MHKNSTTFPFRLGKGSSTFHERRMAFLGYKKQEIIEEKGEEIRDCKDYFFYSASESNLSIGEAVGQ